MTRRLNAPIAEEPPRQGWPLPTEEETELERERRRMTRESWLNQLTDHLRPTFQRAGFTLPEKVNVSCGWPTARALRSPTNANRTVGQCFSAACSADGRSELFISPSVSNAADVAAILVHELCHAALDCQGGHGPTFRRTAIALGLTGKMTSTTAGPELAERLNGIIGSMNAYPHATLDAETGRKKEGTRLIKIICTGCGYNARTTSKWIEGFEDSDGRTVGGLPTCPCNTPMIVAPKKRGPKKKRKPREAPKRGHLEPAEDRQAMAANRKRLNGGARGAKLVKRLIIHAIGKAAKLPKRKKPAAAPG